MAARAEAAAKETEEAIATGKFNPGGAKDEKKDEGGEGTEKGQEAGANIWTKKLKN